MMKVFLWGTGSVADEMMVKCKEYISCEILGFIDNNKAKVGGEFCGKKIFAPEILKTVKPDKIVVMTDYFQEVRAQIMKDFPEMEGNIENKYFFFKNIILNRYQNTENEEIRSVLNYIENNVLDVYNYEYKEKYKTEEIAAFFDEDCGLYYVYHKGKKLYFARYIDTEEKAKAHYRGLLIGQDEQSPHKYMTQDFCVEEGDVVVDAGVAEGDFSLEVVEKASKIYLFETNVVWLEALQQTFKDYADKVVIVNKFVTSTDSGMYATLDSIVEEPVNFIKMDIEGNEWDALQGAEKIIEKSDRVKCSICSYHRDFDEILIKDLLVKYGFECTTSDGYMWFPYALFGENVSTRLCRGVVRGIKGANGKGVF